MRSKNLFILLSLCFLSYGCSIKNTDSAAVKFNNPEQEKFSVSYDLARFAATTYLKEAGESWSNSVISSSTPIILYDEYSQAIGYLFEVDSLKGGNGFIVISNNFFSPPFIRGTTMFNPEFMFEQYIQSQKFYSPDGTRQWYIIDDFFIVRFANRCFKIQGTVLPIRELSCKEILKFSVPAQVSPPKVNSHWVNIQTLYEKFKNGEK